MGAGVRLGMPTVVSPLLGVHLGYGSAWQDNQDWLHGTNEDPVEDLSGESRGSVRVDTTDTMDHLLGVHTEFGVQLNLLWVILDLVVNRTDALWVDAGRDVNVGEGEPTERIMRDLDYGFLDPLYLGFEIRVGAQF